MKLNRVPLLKHVIILTGILGGGTSPQRSAFLPEDKTAFSKFPSATRLHVESFRESILSRFIDETSYWDRKSRSEMT